MFSRAFVGLATWLVPWFYYGYCSLVWKTSRHEDHLNETINTAVAKHGGVVTVMWHEEVFTVAYSYGSIPGAVALASTSNFGRIVTRLLERCGAGVFRGGSSKGRVRRRRVLHSMIEHMNTTSPVLFGLTVDGSRGPVYRMKTGSLIIAKECRAPVYVVRTWYAHKLRLPTWDRSAIPLPFNRIYQRAIGPFWIDPDSSPEQLEEAHRHIERELLELAARSEQHLTRATGPLTPLRDFPEDWLPRWPDGEFGEPLGARDLQAEDPPSWARSADSPGSVSAPDEA